MKSDFLIDFECREDLVLWSFWIVNEFDVRG